MRGILRISNRIGSINSFNASIFIISFGVQLKCSAVLINIKKPKMIKINSNKRFTFDIFYH